MKYQRSTTLGSKDIEIRKVEFVTKTQFIYLEIDIDLVTLKNDCSKQKLDFFVVERDPVWVKKLWIRNILLLSQDIFLLGKSINQSIPIILISAFSAFYWHNLLKPWFRAIKKTKPQNHNSKWKISSFSKKCLVNC